MADFDAVQVATRWLAAEPDDDIRDELQALIDGDPAVLAERFAGRLTFGTAGSAGAVGAGPLRMNRLVVRQAAAGLASYLKASDPRAAERGVVIGYDVRRKSDLFAQDTARVMAAAGLPAMLLPDPLPTPVLAWSITELDAAAGVMVTASHNPPADNGYKVYLGDGAQIVPPHDVAIADEIALVDATEVALADPDDALITTLDDGVTAAYLASIAGVRLRPDVPGDPGGLHADARRRRGDDVHGLRARRLRSPGGRRRAVRARRDVPDGVVPEPGGAGGDGPVARPRRRVRCRAGDRQRPRRRSARRGDPAARRLVAATRRRRDRLVARRPHPRQHDRRRPVGDHDARVVVAARRHGQELRRARQGDLHRVQVDRQDDPRQPRPALRARLRAGARLPRRAPPARQGRHLGGVDARRGGGGRRRRGDDAAAAPRRHRRPLRPPRHDRQVGADGSGRRGRRPSSGCRRARRRRSAAPGSSTSWRSPRPTCCASSSPAACACRSARAAPSRR